MKVSLDWLGEHIDLTSYSSDDLDSLLTFSGIEVESIITIPDKVIVAEIKTIEPHANADKLSVCLVNDGDKDEISMKQARFDVFKFGIRGLGMPQWPKNLKSPDQKNSSNVKN